MERKITLVSLSLMVGIGSALAQGEGATPTPVPGAILHLILDDAPLTKREKKELVENKNAYQGYSIDLNNDGHPELIVKADNWYHCGSGGCDAWIFQKNQHGYQQILYAFGRPSVLQASTNGYRNLVFSYQSGAYSQFRQTYQWNGHDYQEADCVNTVTNPQTNQQTQRSCH